MSLGSHTRQKNLKAQSIHQQNDSFGRFYSKVGFNTDLGIITFISDYSDPLLDLERKNKRQ